MAKVKRPSRQAGPKADKPAATITKSFTASDRNLAYVLGAFAFILYAQTISFGYALDDVAVISNNTFVQQGFKGFGKILSTFYWHGNPSFAESNSGLFRPLSLLMFATEWQLFGDKPSVFHFVHVLLYAVVAIQLFHFLRTLFGQEGGRVALIATLLWIVLPVHTEVVSNLKSADEILSLLFALVGLRWILKWDANRKMTTLVIASVFFFLSMLSKEAAVLIIPIALLMLMMFRGKSVRQLLVPGTVLLMFSLAWLGWHYSVISNATAPRVVYDYRHNALLSSASGIDQLGTAIGLQSRYWIKMLFGYPLSYNYSFNEIPVNGFSDIWPWLSIAGIITAGYFAGKYFRTQPIVSFAIIFYAVTIILTSNIFYKIGDIFAERFTFVPSIGFCILIAFLIVRNSKSAMTSTAIGLTSLLVLSYGVRTFARSSDWKDEKTLFIADAEHSPNSARVHDNVGVIYLNTALGTTDEVARQQFFSQAYDEYLLASTIDPRDFQASQAIGQILYHKKDFRKSIEWSLKSVESRRSLNKELGNEVVDDPVTFLNIGDAYVRLDQFDSAIYYYELATAFQPRADVWLKIGDTHLRDKDTTAALASYGQSVTIDSTYTASWDKIANIKGMRKDYAGSNYAFTKIARLDSLNPNPWKMLYTNYSLMGDSLGMKAAAAEYYKRGGK